MPIQCRIEDGTLMNEDDIEIDSLLARCSRCDHVEVSYGTSIASEKRCLVLLRKNCPRNEQNFYIREKS